MFPIFNERSEGGRWRFRRNGSSQPEVHRQRTGSGKAASITSAPDTTVRPWDGLRLRIRRMPEPTPTMPQSWNAYAYVDNKPLTMTDPSGMSLFSSLWGTVSNWFAGGGGSELVSCESFSDSGSCGSSNSGANPYPGASGFMFSATGQPAGGQPRDQSGLGMRG